MIDYLWGAFLLIGIVYGFFNGRIVEVNNEFLVSASSSVSMIMKILPVMCLWMGVMNIAKKSGLLEWVSRKLSPFLSFLFPDLPKGHESLSLIASNMVMNILGLGNAATPFGLKAMKLMQDINVDKKRASRSMITFLVINTASVTLIPTTVISFRMLYNASDPSDILFCSILTTICSCLMGIIIDRLFASLRRN